MNDAECRRFHYLVFGVDPGLTPPNGPVDPTPGSPAHLFRQALRKSTRGRKAGFPYELLLLGLLIAASLESHTHYTAIRDALTRRVPMAWQYAWGIRQYRQSADGSLEVWVLSEDDLENVGRRVRDFLDYSTNRCQASEEVRQQRYQTLTAIVDAVIDNTLPPRPSGAEDYAIDGTGIWAAERMVRKPKGKAEFAGDEDLIPVRPLELEDIDAALADYELPAGPLTEEQDRRVTSRRHKKLKHRARGGVSDANWGVKTNKRGYAEFFYGYEMHAVVRVPDRVKSAKNQSEPILLERFRLTPAATDVPPVSLEILDSILGKGQPVRKLMADRHYSYKKWRKWGLELIKRGIQQVVMLRTSDQKFDEVNGMLVTAGHVHCPATPPDLAKIEQPNLKTAEDHEVAHFLSRVDERYQYAAQCTRPLKEDGKSRWRCPAAAGKLGCPLRPGSVAVAVELGLPVVAHPPAPETAPALCTQDTVGVEITNDKLASVMKTYQRSYWGSDRWYEDARRRTAVEGWFGTLKGDRSAAKKRGSSLHLGLALVSLEVLAFAVTANLIHFDSWASKTGYRDSTNPLDVSAGRAEKRAPVYLTDAEYEEYKSRSNDVVDEAA